MAEARRKRRGAAGPSVLTANDILSGRVVWWTGDAWGEGFEGAAKADDDAARASFEEIATAEEAADRVVSAAVVELDPTSGLPIALREERRLAGPSISLPDDRDGAPSRAA